MKNLLFRDKKIRRIILQKETERLALKKVYLDQRVKLQTRWKAGCLLKELPSQSNSINAKNRCVHTGRSRSVIRNFRLSRINFRDRAAFGLLLGVVKKSW